MQKCEICNGQKYYYGMGNMRVKCDECNATGFIKQKKEPLVKINKPKKFKEELDVRTAEE